ncbi:MAG: ABC transporter permease [Planctomycetes bacterium]|nr:ABC transporter permease [Planctomycetota bacterium]
MTSARPIPWNLVGAALAICLVAGVFAIIEPSNRDAGALMEVLRISSVNTILATGMTLLLASGGLDLSVGSVLALSATAMSFVTEWSSRAGLAAESGWFASIPAACAGVIVGAACGALNGAFVVFGRIPPFLVTLSALLIARGACYNLLGSSSRSGIPYIFKEIGRTPSGAAAVAIGVAACGMVALSRMRFGRQLLAIGGNEEAARLSGIPVARVKWTMYALSGAFAGLAGGVLAGRTGVVTNTDGDGYELDAIAATVIGGTSLLGGRASMIGTLLGAVLLGIVRFGLQSVQAPAGTQKIASGIVILIPALVDSLRRSRRL